MDVPTEPTFRYHSAKRMNQRRFGYIAVVLLAIATGGGLRWASVVAVGLGSDDYPQHVMVEGAAPVERSLFDLYNCWSGGTAAETRLLMNFGTIPWWTHPELRLAMMRPLSSALIAFDYHVLDKNQVAFHLHSMIWWAFLIVCSALLLREVLPRQMAAVAVLLFAMEEGHGLPLLWLANRNALVSLSFGLLGLWSHIRWRRGKGRSYLVLSVVMFSLGLLGGEWTMPVFAYLFAFELLGTRDRLSVRFRALLPAATLGLLFLFAQHLLSYAALNSDVYVNPTSDPLEYLVRASQRFPVFFGDLVLGVPSVWYQTGTPLRHVVIHAVLDWNLVSPEVWRQLPEWQLWQVVLGSLAGLIGLLVIRWGFRYQPPRLLRELGWLLLGALLSMLPMVASFPSSRLVLPASVGVSTAFAAILLTRFRHLRESWHELTVRSRAATLAVLLAVLGVQVFLSGLHSQREVRAFAYFFESVRQWVLQSDIDDSKSEEQHVFLLNSIEHTTVLFSPYVLRFHGRPMPRSIRILSAAPHAHDVLRTDERTLEMTVLGGSLMESDLETLYRAERFPLNPGDRVKTDEFEALILRGYDGKPVSVRFVFKRSLEDDSYLFLFSTLNGLRRFLLPAVGQKLRVPKAVFPDLALLRPHLVPPPMPRQVPTREAEKTNANEAKTEVDPTDEAEAVPADQAKPGPADEAKVGPADQAEPGPADEAKKEPTTRAGPQRASRQTWMSPQRIPEP